MRRTPFIVAVVLTSALSMTTAFATPPTGEVKFKDMTRAHAVESATVPTKPGNNFASGSYSVAPGGATGWRQLHGTPVPSSTKATSTPPACAGCAANEHGA